MDAAAPLLCAGITVYSPMIDNNLHETPGKRIGIVGLGGLGHVAIKFGKAFGHHVTVISTSPSKEKEARERLGADDFIISTDPQQMQSKMRTLDFILDTVAAPHSIGPILELLKVKGTLVLVGAPDKPLDLPSFPLIFGKRVVKGSIIGGMKETQEMMNFCGKHNITCEIETVTPDRINEGLTRLANNDPPTRPNQSSFFSFYPNQSSIFIHSPYPWFGCVYILLYLIAQSKTVRWGDVSMMICVEGCVMKEKNEVDAGGGEHHRWWLEKDRDGGSD
nr:probable cinnamyl alcohol dehydrogenase 6 [Tanacetum cinerariifolium]